MSVIVCYDGGGWTIPYMIGVTKALQDQQRAFATDASDATDATDALDATDASSAFVGVSSGACVALAAALGVPMESLLEECIAWARICRACPQLTVTAVRAICVGRLAEHSADDVTRILKDRFAVGVSRQKKNRSDRVLEPHVVSCFDSPEDVAAIVAASCTVPYVNTFPRWIPEEERKLGYIDGVLTMRFFTPPMISAASTRVIRVTSATDRRDADICCPKQTSLLAGIVPPTDRELVELYDLGVAEGPKLARLLRAEATGKKTASPIGIHTNDDRSTRFHECVHVGRRRDVRVSVKEGHHPRSVVPPVSGVRNVQSAAAARAAEAARRGGRKLGGGVSSEALRRISI